MSSVPAVLAALVTLATATLPNSQVINGGIGTATTTTGRFLLVGDDEILIERQFDSMSNVTFSEEYVVPLTVGADLPGTDQAAADTQALADYETFLQAVADHPQGPTLGLGDGVSVLPVGSHRFVRLADENGRHAAVRFGVRVYSQLS